MQRLLALLPARHAHASWLAPALAHACLPHLKLPSAAFIVSLAVASIGSADGIAAGSSVGSADGPAEGSASYGSVAISLGAADGASLAKSVAALARRHAHDADGKNSAKLTAIAVASRLGSAG